MNILLLVHPDCLSEQYSWTPKQAEAYLGKLEEHLPKFDKVIVFRMVPPSHFKEIVEKSQDQNRAEHAKKLDAILKQYADIDLVDYACGEELFKTTIGDFFIDNPKGVLYLSGGYQNNCLRSVAQSLAIHCGWVMKENGYVVRVYEPLVYRYERGRRPDGYQMDHPWWTKEWSTEGKRPPVPEGVHDIHTLKEKGEYPTYRGEWWEGPVDKISKLQSRILSSSRSAVVANSKFTAAFDIDDTICITSPSFTEALQNKGYNVREEDKDAARWFRSSTGDVPREVEEGLFVDFLKNGTFKNLPVVPGAKEVLDQLKAEGARIVLITARPEGQLREVTEEWLEKNQIPYDALYFTENKEIPAQKEGIDFLVDDDLKNVFDRNKVIVIDQPWNKKYDGKKIKSLDEVLTLNAIKKQAGQPLKRNYDFGGNYLDRLRKVLKQKKLAHVLPREPVAEDTDLSGGYIERMKKRQKKAYLVGKMRTLKSKLLKKAVKEYFSLEEMLECLAYEVDDLKIEYQIGDERDFTNCPKTRLPFAYGEIPNYINPVDDMAWDVIILPSAVNLPKEKLMPVGVLRYNRDVKFWDVLPGEDPIGNDKILLGQRKSQGANGGVGIYTQADAQTIYDFIEDKPAFEKPEFFFEVTEEE